MLVITKTKKTKE